MNNSFLNNIKTMSNDTVKYENKAFDSIISNLFIKNIHGKEKALGLDEYDSESNSKLILIPGHIYAFKYITLNPSKYNDGRIKFEYYDSLPIILCTSNNKNIISGINLNLCNYALRTLILNDIYNLDPLFFEKDASEQAHKGLLPISNIIGKFFMNKRNEELLLNTIVLKYKLKNSSLIFRNYNIKKILALRFIEPWQWKYIPFINYKQSVKEPVLLLIHRVTGIDKIKI